MQAGAQLVQVPENGEWEGAKRVSFMGNSFTNIEGSPRCFDLVTLILRFNKKLESITKGFFQFMTRLTVLDLSWTNIKELPLEIQNMQFLEYLNLSSTNLEQLPIELKRLEKLKYFNLEHTVNMHMIPVQVMSNFSQLLHLNIFQCGSNFLYEVEDNVLSKGNLLIEELQCLQNLSELSITIRSVSTLQSFCCNQKLLNCTRALMVFRCEDASFLNISSLTNAKQLEIVELRSNEDLEELVVEEKETQTLGSLNYNSFIYCGLRVVTVRRNSRI